MGTKCCTSSDYLNDDPKFCITSQKSKFTKISKISSISRVSKINSMVNSPTSSYSVKNIPQSVFSYESENCPKKEKLSRNVDAAEVGYSYFRNKNNLNRNLKIDAANITNMSLNYSYANIFNRPSSPQFFTYNDPFSMTDNNKMNKMENKNSIQNNYNQQAKNLTEENSYNFKGFGNDIHPPAINDLKMEEDVNFDKYFDCNNVSYTVA